MSIVFSGIRSALEAFRAAPLEEPDLAHALQVLESDKIGATSLGFKKRKARTSDDLQRHLTEHGINLSDGKFKRLVEILRLMDERSQGQRRFFAQAALSIMVVAFAVLLLGLADVNDSVQKALFGLLGTVLGYWLR